MSTCMQASFLNLWGNTIEALAGLSIIYGFFTIAFITDASGMLLHAHEPHVVVYHN